MSHLMEVTKYRDKWLYKDVDCSFTLTNESIHDHTTTIIAPKHIKIVVETDKQTLTTKELKQRIINDWFSVDNETTRNSNNLKRRLKK